MKRMFSIENIRKVMLKIKFADGKREIVKSVREIFRSVCKNICLKRGVVFRQSGDFSKADAGRKYGVSISRNHASILGISQGSSEIGLI